MSFEDFEDPEKRRCLYRFWINIPGGRELAENFADRYNTGLAAASPWVKVPATCFRRGILVNAGGLAAAGMKSGFWGASLG